MWKRSEVGRKSEVWRRSEVGRKNGLGFVEEIL